MFDNNFKFYLCAATLKLSPIQSMYIALFIYVCLRIACWGQQIIASIFHSHFGRCPLGHSSQCQQENTCTNIEMAAIDKLESDRRTHTHTRTPRQTSKCVCVARRKRDINAIIRVCACVWKCVFVCGWHLCKKQLMKTEIKTARGMLMTLQGWYLIYVCGSCVKGSTLQAASPS